MVLEDHKGHKHQETISMYIVNIGQQDIILGTGWLIKHNPEINWETYNLSFTRGPATCEVERDFMVKSIHDDKKRTARARRTLLPEKLWTEDHDHPEQYVNQWTHMGLKPARAFFPETKSLYAQLSPLAQDVDPKYSNISQQLAQKAARDAIKKKVEDIVPNHYHEYLSIFDSKKSERFPPSRVWDHAINLKPDFMPKDCKIYPLSEKEKKVLKEFIKENKEKGYIRESESPQASPFFFVGKKDGNLRPCQDYKALNAQTVKNAYPIPLISEIVDKLKTAKYFTKFDVRKGYNNVRIRDGNQWKAAFKCSKGLFEPMVMFFGLCNSPATCQTMMNTIFRDLIDKGLVIVYLDNILIFTDSMEEQRRIVKEVLRILKKHGLYLKPEKCEFEKERVEYLGLIIRHGHTEMDPVKVAGIMDWPTPKKVKEVQAFLGFCNFYRHFEEKFLHIARPLFELTKKGQVSRPGQGGQIPERWK
jgi:hypothetical protein